MSKLYYSVFGIEKAVSPQFIYSDKTLDDYKRLFEENKLEGKTSWFNFYDKNRDRLLKEGYFKRPWQTFKISQAEFFDYILDRFSKLDLTEDLIKKSIIEYFIKYKKWPKTLSKDPLLDDGTSCGSIDALLRRGGRGLKGGLSLPLLVKEVMLDSFQYKNREIEDYIKLFDYNNLKSKVEWNLFYDNNKVQLENKGFIKTPWSKLGMSQKDFFNHILRRNTIRSPLEDYKMLFEENNLTGHGDWFKYYDKNKDKLSKDGYIKTPWRYFNISQKKFIDIVLNKNNSNKLGELEHINFIKSNNIKSYTEYNKFKKPKCYYGNMTTLQKYFPDIQYKLGWKFNLTLDDYKKLFNKNDIKSFKDWYIYFNKNKDELFQIGYKETPWQGFKISQKEFFDYVLNRK